MSEDPFENYVCWTQQKLSSIINVEALSIERPVFLATHVPFDKIIYLDSPQNIADTSEERLLGELVERGRNAEHTFLVVQGMAGSGKSHLIRWLYERYEALRSPDDEVVMLIERANSSLRQTLLQIIQHDQFDSSRFTEQIERIGRATNQLSDDALRDTLLHWLSVGSKEVTGIDVAVDKVERHRKRTDPYVAEFLLNPKVREHLKRNGGPIERLIRHLSSGKNVKELYSENNPIFEADDFDFAPNQLHEIKEGGYEATQKLAEYLNRKPSGRLYIAKYLNALISYAIQQTTQISVDDLKALFFELRRELKAQGKSLVLMVEDISVFTGLDAGLIDVMITQHTGGETQKSLCRMTSIVGVTDGYYKEKFPQNIKQRIKHRITLNADVDGVSKTTNLFDDIGDMAKFVSRYLNLLRMPTSDFEKWTKKEGCEPTALPSACSGCEFRERCHLAFGSVELDGTDDERDVGLYPFNKNLLTVINNNLDTTVVSKTPRTLLELVEYMLGHAPAIKNGTFPDHKPLPYLKSVGFNHFNHIKANARKDADRLERFMMYWGDGSIDEVNHDGIKTIGGIPTYAYEAFGLPVIDGQKFSPDDIPQVPSVPETRPTETKEEEVRSADAFKDDVFESIHRWRRGDDTLRFHAEIKRTWHSYLKNRIDWDHYHVTHTQLAKFSAPQLVIEEQGSKASGAYLYFERSDELAEFFEALTQIDKYFSELPPAKLSRYLLILEHWLDNHEGKIVQFVKTPYKREDGPPGIDTELDQILFENNVYYAMLGGDLQPSGKTGPDLVEALARQPEEFNSIWNKSINDLRTERGHSSEWIDAIKWGSSRNKVHYQREQFLQMLNRPQGDSRKEAKFIDAPYLLERIEQFNKRRWAIDTGISIDFSGADQTYKEWLQANLYLQAYGDAILAAEEDHVRQTLSTLSLRLGTHSPAKVFDAIEATLEALKSAGRPYGRFRLSEDLTAKKLQNRIETLENVQSKESRKEKMLAYSSIYNIVRDVWEYIDLFKAYGNLLEAQINQVEEELGDAGGSPAVIDPGKDVETEYHKILEALASVLQAEQPDVEVIA